jgi:hypothetical protein
MSRKATSSTPTLACKALRQWQVESLPFSADCIFYQREVRLPGRHHKAPRPGSYKFLCPRGANGLISSINGH